MKITTTAKTLTMLGLMSLGLAAGPGQADSGVIYFNNNPYANPYLNAPAYQQARMAAAVRERLMRLDQRQDAQLQRITRGIEEGRLTDREAVALLREHLAISTLERRYLIDGRLGPRELDDLEYRLAEAERHIKFERNDRDVDRGHHDHRDGGRGGEAGWR